MEDGTCPYFIIMAGSIVFLLICLVGISFLCKDTLAKKMKSLRKGKLMSHPEDVTQEEIISMLEEGHEQGIICSSEAKMIHNIFEFDEKEAQDIMTPRKHLMALEGSVSYIDSLAEMIRTNKSRYPVYQEDIDHIIGILHIKDALALVQKNELYRTPILDIEGLVQPVEVIPQTMKINTLFSRMQLQKNHLVIVIDEYGQTSGVVSLEDILEEIVGNIEDEHDEEDDMMQVLPDGSYCMDGLIKYQEAAACLGLPEDEDFDTLNGFLIAQMGKIPRDSDLPEVSYGAFLFDIQKIEDKTIREVIVKKKTVAFDEKE